jgi:glycosyltransferase involved in cell wall biosynthesis
MRIAVAMATYHGERYVERQLASIAAQTRLPDVLYVRDDASSDGTVSLLKAFAASAPFPVHVVVNEHHAGVTLNFEHVINDVGDDGDVIVLADQDDVWLPLKLAHLERVFAGSPQTTLAFSDAFLIDADGNRAPLRRWALPGFTAARQRELRSDPFAQLMSHYIVSGCMLAFRNDRRDLFLPFPAELQFADSDMHVLHDKWLAIVMALAGDVEVIAEPLLEYRIHPNQTIGVAPRSLLRKALPPWLRWQLVAYRARRQPAYLAGMLTLLHIMRSRADESLGGPQRLEALHDIDEAILHLQARSGFAGSRARRVPGVIREIRAGRYNRYSFGPASAVVDVLRPQAHPHGHQP